MNKNAGSNISNTMGGGALLGVNPDWANLPLFDRKECKTMQFGDVVKNVNKVITDREKNGINRVLGLDDIDSGNLHITRWKSPGTNPSFRTHFLPGQTLFGKRRAYLRKVALAGFEGVCTQNILVFESKDKSVFLPELLPFLCQSDRFFQHTVATSKGSLFPNADWNAIKSFEFTLPPLDQQRRIAEILWAVDEVVENWRETKLKAEKAYTAKVKAMMLGAVDGGEQNIRDIGAFSPPRGWTMRRAKELVASPITKGATPSPFLNTKRASVPFLKVYNLTFTGALDFSVDPTYVEPEVHETELKRSQVRSGDILMNLVGPPLGKTALIPDGFPEANINQAIAIYRIEDRAMREFFFEYLRSDLAQRWLERRSKKTSGQRNLTLALAQDLPVPIPPAEIMSEVVKNARSFFTIHSNISLVLEAAKCLGQSITNGLWS